MRVLVTGGAGFIGSHVCELLLRRGGDVLALDNLATGSPGNIVAGIDLALADICDTPMVCDIARAFSPEVVVHLAAHTIVAESITNPGVDAQVNVGGTLSVLEAAAAAGSRKIIFASSSTVYGEPLRQPVREEDRLLPISPYGVSKLAGEEYMRVVSGLHRMRHTILRLGNVFGPRDSPLSHHVITSFVDALASGGQPVIEWDGRQSKDYVYVGDVAEAVAAALDHGDDEVFNIAGEQRTSVMALLELVAAATGTVPAALHGPKREGDVREFVMDCSKARELLGWHAHTSLAEGISATVDAASHEHRSPGSEVVAG
jgi:UDP-glucose 4-epimerase